MLILRESYVYEYTVQKKRGIYSSLTEGSVNIGIHSVDLGQKVH